MCSAHALFVFKVSRLNFLRSFSDRCARSPRSFENQRAVAERRLGRRSSERRLLFKSKRLRSSRQLLKAVWAEFWKMMFFLEEINLSEGLHQGIFIFHEAHGRSSLAQFQVAASAGTSLWQVCDWSWKNHRSAKRRERTDARPERPA